MLTNHAAARSPTRSAFRTVSVCGAGCRAEHRHPSSRESLLSAASNRARRSVLAHRIDRTTLTVGACRRELSTAQRVRPCHEFVQRIGSERSKLYLISPVQASPRLNYLLSAGLSGGLVRIFGR